MGAQYSGYIEFKAKGAPLAFVFPETGVPAVSETYGIVQDGPHPNAAELFMDWFLARRSASRRWPRPCCSTRRARTCRRRAGRVPLKNMKLLSPGRLERLREGSSGLRQGMGPHRRRRR